MLTDYYSGVMFALANNVKEARQMLLKDMYGTSLEEMKKDLSSRPDVYQKPFSLAMYGGG